MNDHELIDKINVLLINATESGKLKDRDNQCEYLEMMVSLYEQLSLKSKKQFKRSIYLAHRDLGRLYEMANQYEKALYHLREAKKLPDFKTEEFIIKCQMDVFIVSLSIKLYLITNSKSYLKNIRGLNNSLLKMKKIPQELEYKINSNQSILQEIDKGAKVKTVIWFDIPSPLPIKENTPINFRIDDVLHVLEIEIIKTPHSFVKSKGAFLTITEDKFGLVNKSKIKLTIFKYIDPNERAEIKTFSDKKDVSKVLLEATNALNYFIEHYRIVTGNYWIETVFYNMITKFTFENLVGNQKYRATIISMDHVFQSSPSIPWLKDSEVTYLEKCLDMEEVPLWKTLLLDAKDYLLRRDYREAIFAINGAFENYLMLKAREILSEAWGKEKASEYLKGVPIYKYHKLKGYITECNFNRAIKDEKIGKMVPPTGQILKEVYNIHKPAISRTKLDRLVKQIRENRDEIAHGNDEINGDLEIIAFEAIEGFEEFIKLFQS